MSLRHTVDYNQYRGHQLVTDSAVEPITKAEVKAQLKIDGADEDSQLDIYIKAARQYLESMTGLALINQTWLLAFDQWPTHGEPWWDGVKQMAISALYSSGRASDVFLPRYPLSSVDSMTVDGSSVTTTDYFIVDSVQRPGRLVLKQGATFPILSTLTANGILIQYTAGYGAASTDVPETLRLALIQMVATYYTHRGDGCTVQKAYEQSGAKELVAAYTVRGL